MRYVLWTLLGLIVLFIGLTLHYTLSQYDTVRIVNTEVRRIDAGANSIFWNNASVGEATGRVNRDVFFIDAIRPSGRPIVYRNEDTGFLWPPYFKFNSATLQARASDFASSPGAERWVAIRHYGWRSEWFSIFPNAISIRQVEGPDDKPFNWQNVVLLVILALLVALLVRTWIRFRKRRIDPVVEDIEEAASEARARGRGFWRRLTGR